MPSAEDMDRQGQPEIEGVDNFQHEATDGPHQLDPRTGHGTCYSVFICGCSMRRSTGQA